MKLSIIERMMKGMLTKMKKIDIICPLYNAEKFIENLHLSLLRQEKVNINSIIYVLTESEDRTEEILKRKNLNYKLIKKSEFSHSLVRENAAKESEADIIVFITQDIIIKNNDWLEKLVSAIIDGEAEACYSRQLTKYNNIEKYIRESNYPDVSVIKTKADIDKLGLKTFFFSDASSAIDAKIFKKLNYYDGKNFMFNEDMYIAHKLIMNNYRIKYCADSVIYHSHKFSLKQLYKRYKDSGNFFKENKYMDQYGTTNSGINLAKYVFKRILQERRFLLLFRFPFDMGARLIGMKVGKNENTDKR